MSKLKTIELKAKAVINGVEHAAGDVVEVVEHWAEWLIKGEVAQATNKKPTRPSPTPMNPEKAANTAAGKSPSPGAAATGAGGGSGAESKPAGE